MNTVSVLALLLGASQFTGCGSGDSDRSWTSSNGEHKKVVLGDSCVSSDLNKLCLGIHFVSYKNSQGQAVAGLSEVETIVRTMNDLWKECAIGFQVEEYQSIDPSQYGLSFGEESQQEVDKIRQTFATIPNELLAVTTGPWGTAVNAWTAMPGEGPYGAVMEASVVTYGKGIIYAHEFGHYLGLDHVSDQEGLMNPTIYPTSLNLDSSECDLARKTAKNYWPAMFRY